MSGKTVAMMAKTPSRKMKRIRVMTSAMLLEPLMIRRVSKRMMMISVLLEEPAITMVLQNLIERRKRRRRLNRQGKLAKSLLMQTLSLLASWLMWALDQGSLIFSRTTQS